MEAPHDATHHGRTVRGQRRPERHVFYEFPYTGQGGPKTGRTGGRTEGAAHRAAGIGIDAAPPWGRPRDPALPKVAPAGSPG
jgi:hypothetical protein